MNERIKLLAEQAGIAVWGDAVYMYDPKDTLDSTVIAKFAELIVKECCTKMALEIMDHYVYYALKNTYEHFGVEE